jgi:acyl carrier protein
MTEHIVTEVLATVTGRPIEECAQPQQHLFHHLGLDSLGLLETIEQLQARAHCTIPDEVTGQVKTVADLQAALALCADTPEARIAMSEDYLRGHQSVFFERQNRFLACADRLRHHGLGDGDVLFDLGAGLTELDYHLRVSHGWRGRYVPVDAWVNGVDLLQWTPPRRVEWFAALELLEHLEDPKRFVEQMQEFATKGFIVTTPNPDRVDVLAMDPTHKTPLDEGALQGWGMRTTLHNFYGFHQDGIAGIWTP